MPLKREVSVFIILSVIRKYGYYSTAGGKKQIGEKRLNAEKIPEKSLKTT